MRYQHIIWDWNGTLLDDAWLCIDVMNGMLTRRGMEPLSAARYEHIFDFPVEDYYRAAGFDFAREPFEVLSDEFIAGYKARVLECDLRAGARAALQQAAAQRRTQSILSAMEQTQLDRLMAHFGLRALFTDVVGLSDHHARGKIGVGRRWLADQTIDPSAMLFVGDTTHDHEVAAALGVDCVHIHSGHHARQRLAATGAPLIESLAEVVNGRL